MGTMTRIDMVPKMNDGIDFETLKLIRPIETNLKKIGTSVGFIIPAKVAEYLGLKVGDEVNLYIEKKE